MSAVKSRSFDKARPYHRRWCWCERRVEEGIIVWRFALAPKFSSYTQMVDVQKDITQSAHA